MLLETRQKFMLHFHRAKFTYRSGAINIQLSAPKNGVLLTKEFVKHLL